MRYALPFSGTPAFQLQSKKKNKGSAPSEFVVLEYFFWFVII